jgi:citrate/tricarballylate utilization protein
MAGGAALALGWAVLALALATRSYWRAIRPPAPWLEMLRALPAATADIITLRNLGGAGCRDAEDGAPEIRRILHQTMVAGLGLCVVATAAAAVYGHLLGWAAPYPLASLPVLAGLVGGVLLAAGALGLLWRKRRADSAPLAPETTGGEVAALALLAAVGLSGLAVLALRGTGAMALTLALHLGLVAGLFAVLPYSKLIHAPFRAAALLRAAVERRRTRA